MLIYIHTAGRPERQTTFKSFTPALMERTRLVVQAHEEQAHTKENYPQLVVLPKNITKLSPTRQTSMFMRVLVPVKEIIV